METMRVGGSEVRRRTSVKSAGPERRSDPRVEERDAGDDDSEDLETYLEELASDLEMSVRAHRALAIEFRKSTVTKKLATIAELESELEKKRRGATAKRGNNNRELEEEEAKVVEEERPTEIQNVLENLFKTSDIKDEELEEAFEKLITENLTPDKQELLRRQFHNERDTEKRFHMYMEFSSYFRAPSDAALKYQDMISAEDSKGSYLNTMGASTDIFGSKSAESVGTGLFTVAFLCTLVMRYFMGGLF